MMIEYIRTRFRQGLIAMVIAFTVLAPVKAEINTDLILAAQEGKLGQVKSLLQRGANVNAVNPGGRSALGTAAYFGNYEIVKLLLAMGADVNAVDRQGVSPVIDAAASGNPRVIRALISNGADINARSNTGVTALSNAQMIDSIAVMEVLVQAGADGARSALRKAKRNRKKNSRLQK